MMQNKRCIDCKKELGIVYHNTKKCTECKRTIKNKRSSIAYHIYHTKKRAKKYINIYEGLTREQQIKAGSDHWYKDIVNGYLDYHYGIEKFNIGDKKK